ncbi:MAG: PDZ domain-containing protein [Clostridia bacterium]|nr:PDZ domain-containing protein [Clostridia bacterium]
MKNTDCAKKPKSVLFVIIATALITAVACFSVFAIFVFTTPGLLELIKLDFLVDAYFYGEKLNDDVKDGLLSGYVDGLNDRYAQYLTLDESLDRKNRLNGVSSGLGITVTKDLDSQNIYVVKVYDDSPAKKVGLEKRDIIVCVDDVSVSELGYTEAVSMIPREIGQTVRLKVLRDNAYIDFEVEYSNIELQTVFFEKIGEYGYIEITSFNSATVEQFYNAVNSLQSKGVKGLIFDVRDNGGGTVNSVGKMLDLLLPEGDLMTVKYKFGNTKVMLKSDEKEIELPMVVLVNSNTASASEVFASNIREFKKGILIGEKSFGKGIMQDTFKLFGDTDVVFTVAELFTHNMKSYHGEGLIPDIEVKLSDKENSERFFIDISKDTLVSAAIDWLDGEINE